MRIQCQLIMIQILVKMLSLDDNCLIKTIYNLLRSDADNNITYNGNNWAHQVKMLLCNNGLQNLGTYQTTLSTNYAQIKTRLLDIYKQTWYSHINNSRRLETYAIYKQTFDLETFLKSINTNKYRISLTKFRLSAHDLAIERDRHEGITCIHREHRTCTNCQMGMVENEFHFLLVCPKYYDLRRFF